MVLLLTVVSRVWVNAAEPPEVAIRSAVEDLDSPNFSTRERAARELWSFGADAEPVLRQVAESNRLEARQRAAQILADFDFGITPDVPAHIAKLFRQYRSGTHDTRSQVFSMLIESGEFGYVQRLLKHAKDRGTRHAVYSQSIQSTPIMMGMIERNELDAWISVMAQDGFVQPRHEVVSKWLTSQNVLATLASQNNLAIVDLAIDQESTDENRNRLLRRLFVQREFTDFYSSVDQLDRMFQYINRLPGKVERHELFVRFLSLARAATLYEQESLSKMVRFASTRGTTGTLDELWTYMIETVLPRPEVATRLTAERIEFFVDQLDDANFDRFIKSLRQHAPLLADSLNSRGQ